MQVPPTTPTEDDEASIPTEHVRNGPNQNRTFTLRRKAAKRILPWDLPVDEIQLASPPPHGEDTRETKRPRLEEPVATSTDEATTKNTLHDTMVVLSPPDAAVDNDDANEDPETETQPNARTTGAKGRWTLVEDEKLTSAVTNTRKKKHSTNWVVVATLVPGRTKIQCENRWRSALDPSIALTGGSTGPWKDDEDIKLKAAAQTHGGKDWVAIAALVPGRTKKQCQKRWRNALDPSIDGVNGCTGTWKEDEDIKLKGAVQQLGDKDWVAIAKLVPGRTKMQCWSRWHNAWDPIIDRVNGCTGTWKEDEDIKLNAAVQKHGGKNWAAISALVPGRTKKQCCNRWHDVLEPGIDRVNGCTGTWKEDEDIKLKDAVQKHGDKNWVVIAALVPGRTKKQCRNRWHNVLDLSIRVNGCTGTWKEDEDIKLKDAVQKHGDKNWVAIATLVPSRTKMQCRSRWHNALVPGIDGVNGCTGTWKEDEDINLKAAVQQLGDKDWVAIAALVPGRTKKQCWDRWKKCMDPHRSTVRG
jgi:hypothetical protein